MERTQMTMYSPLLDGYGMFYCSLIGTFTILCSESVGVLNNLQTCLASQMVTGKHQNWQFNPCSSQFFLCKSRCSL